MGTGRNLNQPPPSLSPLIFPEGPASGPHGPVPYRRAPSRRPGPAHHQPSSTPTAHSRPFPADDPFQIALWLNFGLIVSLPYVIEKWIRFCFSWRHIKLSETVCTHSPGGGDVCFLIVHTRGFLAPVVIYIFLDMIIIPIPFQRWEQMNDD